MGQLKTRIVFTGDVAFSRCFNDGWKNEGCLSQTVETYLRDCDEVVINLECPLTRQTIKSDRTLTHVGDPGAGEYLRRMHMTNWSLANNHMMDCQAEGLADTIKTAQECGCRTVGAGMSLESASQPLFLGNDIIVGILSVAGDWPYIRAGRESPGVLSFYNKEQIASGIKKLKETAAWVVVVFHNGDEFCDVPLPIRRKQSMELLNMGADIVIGHHPHVVQNYECVGEKKLIVYSLGNFIFDTEYQRHFEHTDTGILLGIDFEEKQFSFDAFPVRIDRSTQQITMGEIPTIFRDISADEYRKLWPLTSKRLHWVDRKRYELLSRKKRKNKLFLFARDLYHCRELKDRQIVFGRCLALLGRHRGTGEANVVKYMSSSTGVD